jgi:hypothetical protein
MSRVLKFGKQSILPLSLVIFIWLTIAGSVNTLWYILWLATAFVVAYTINTIIHELAHWISFKHYGLPIVELSFGVLRFVYVNGQALHVWTPDRPFDFLCSCKGLRDINQKQRKICLLSGGSVNLVTAVIPTVLLVWATSQQIRSLLYVLIAVCALDATINLIYPYSTDRTLLRKINEQEKNRIRGNR